VIKKALVKANANKTTASDDQHFAPEIIGQSSSMQTVFRMIGKLSKSEDNVLITGETGTGKALVAQSIHNNSQRKDRPFIKINTVTIPKGLIEEALFGMETHDSTDSQEVIKGMVDEADGGTLFLDEIGDMPMEIQIRLLRILSDGQFYRVAGKKPVAINIRIIASTNQNLNTLVAKQLFRDDLLRQLNAISIMIPPLRERPDDIPLLTQCFLKNSAQSLKMETRVLSEEALHYLITLNWSGNVLQLENVCHWLTLMTSGSTITIDDFPLDLKDQSNNVAPHGNQEDWRIGLHRNIDLEIKNGNHQVYDTIIQDVEKTLISSALSHTKNRKIDAAKILGIGRNTITRKIKELNIK
jgi:two-component system, NtrC family, nitrogen regulation response regulator GlnG